MRAMTPVAAGLATLVVLLGACGSTPAPTGLVVHAHGLGISVDSASQMCKAPLVMETTVLGTGAGFWNTPTGRRPSDLSKTTLATKGYRIYTPVSFAPPTTLVDHRSSRSGRFVLMGGTVGGDQYGDDDFASVRAGQTYLMVMVPGIDPIAAGPSEKWMVAYAAFPIDTGGNVLLRQKLVEQGQVTQAESRDSIASVSAQLRQCV